MKFLLANGEKVEASLEEIREFITGSVAISNPYWRYSGELTQDQVTRFLKRESSDDELGKAAKYILHYAENLAFTGYLFDKAQGNPEQTKELNMPVLKKLRKLLQEPVNWKVVWAMENLCMKVGLDPL